MTKPWVVLSFLLLGVLKPMGVHAALEKCVNDPQWKCGQCEKDLRDRVLTLVSEIESGAREINTVDALVEALPEEMRRDFILMTESRSFQESSPHAPRVLLKSPDSEIILSFNMDPKHRGYDRAEMMLWNGEKAEFEFIEVAFPGLIRLETAAQELQAQPQSRAQVTYNPPLCYKCHDFPARPNWDPYNFWSGQTPFNKDTLVQGAAETEWYLDILNDIESLSITHLSQ